MPELISHDTLSEVLLATLGAKQPPILPYLSTVKSFKERDAAGKDRQSNNLGTFVWLIRGVVK